MTSLGTPSSHILRAEGLAALVLSVLLYVEFGSGWLLFAVLFLVPDLSMLGYLRNPAVGAVTYNLAHTYVASLGLGIVGMLGDFPLLISLALIWSAHIGFDRLLGYGLKSSDRFQVTHLGVIGKAKQTSRSDVRP